MPQSAQDIRNRLLLARLPAMPQILLKLLELCQLEDAGMGELADLVSSDPAMTAKVMGVANHAAYLRDSRTTDLLRAVNTLGADLLKVLVISESVYQTFNGFPHSQGTDLRRFWKHSLAVAVMAREISRQMGNARTEEAYLGGLLHDVGRLALLAAAPNEYRANFHTLDDEALCAVEQRSLEIDHAEAGAWLIGRWNLDSYLADSVLYHHEPVARIQNAHPLIRIVHLANQLGNFATDDELPAGLGTLCQLSDNQLQDIRQRSDEWVEKEAALLGIDLTGVDELAAPSATLPLDTPPGDSIGNRLQDEIRNATLAAELGQSLARQKDDARLLEMVRQSARILFDLEDTIILLTDPTGMALVGAPLDVQRQRLTEMNIPLASGGNIAEAVLQKKIAFVGRSQSLPSVAEEQLLRLTGAEVLVVTPITAGASCLGSMVSGLPAWRVSDMRRRERLLQAFGSKVGAALEKLRSERAAQEERMQNLRDAHQAEARRVEHEVNNPLTIIRNYMGVINDKLQRQEMVAGELTVIQEELDRVGNIVRGQAGSPPDIQQGTVNINSTIHNMVRLFRDSRFLPASVKITAHAPDRPAEMRGSADALKQILMNLVKNAVEAMPEGGLIQISNQGLVHEDSGAFHSLTVKDNGPGLPADVLQRLFTPVKSSKAGGNRGIGLSIVNDLVKQLGGKISCSSNFSGTTFQLLLPAQLPVPQTAHSASKGASSDEWAGW